MIKTIIALEQDGFDTRVLVLNFDVPNKEFNLKAAVEAAAVEYCQTVEGRETYEGNCGCFNWGDFDAHVTDEICQKHGFRKLAAESSDEIVNFDEQLVGESEIYPEEDDIDEEDEEFDSMLDCDGECYGCDRACADRIPVSPFEEDFEENAEDHPGI